jgi:hypothetical protein
MPISALRLVANVAVIPAGTMTVAGVGINHRDDPLGCDPLSNTYPAVPSSSTSWAATNANSFTSATTAGSPIPPEGCTVGWQGD